MENPKIRDLEFMERSCMTYVMRYLLHNPRKSTSEIISTEGKCFSTKLRRLRELEQVGLVQSMEDRSGGRRRKLYELTPDGMEIAEILDRIGQLMSESQMGVEEKRGGGPLDDGHRGPPKIIRCEGREG